MKKKTDKTKNKRDIGTPHDVAFKSAFQRKELACDFFRHYLHEEITKHINFEKLELVNKSYVDEKLNTYTLTDLSGYEDGSLIGSLALKPVLYMFKHIYDGNFDSAARTVTDMMIVLQNEPDFLTFLEWFLRYLYYARTEDKETLKRIIDREINRLNTKGAKEMAMTVAEQIKKEGRLEGIKQGLEQGREQGLKQAMEKIVLNMLKIGTDMAVICQATGLSEDEIRLIAAQKDQKKWQ